MTQNSPVAVDSTCAVHQYVPAGVSVYWWNEVNLSGDPNTVRDAHQRQAGCPSIAPVTSAGKRTPSFSYAL